MAKVYELYNIIYDTDGEAVKLPHRVLVMVKDNTDISLAGADIISDNTGFLVEVFTFKEITKNIPNNMKVGDFLVK